MPLIQVSMLQGKSKEQKKNLMKALTQAVCDSIGSAPSSVRVILVEIDPDHWAVGGVPYSEVDI